MMVNDFGKNFKVYDRSGVESSSFLVEHISKSAPGVVRLNSSKPHNYRHGDFIRLGDVEGMVEVNGNDARPV